MKAYTPLLPTNSVFEMYVSVLDEYDTTRIFYDTVKCSLEFWGRRTDTDGFYNDFEVNDYQSSVTFHDDSTVGDNLSSVAHFLDTANGGTSDWWQSPFKDDSKVECTESYCDITCTVYRKQVTEDRENDVQYERSGGTLDLTSGYRLWDTRTTQSN